MPCSYQKTRRTRVSESPGLDCTPPHILCVPRNKRPCADGRAVNLALVVVKAVAGVISHSSSLLADAGHSAADILSDVLTLSTIPFSNRDPTIRYPLGFGKVETLGAIGVSSLLRIPRV
jgi:divalent metal cation (Fe/Co/Zn/Cd) transporter